MTRSEYMKKIDFLVRRSVVSLESYQLGWIDINEFKERLNEIVSLYPLGYCLEDDFYGEFTYVGGEEDQKTWMLEVINCAEKWDESKFTVMGSNSFLFNLFGENELFEVLK